MTNDPYEAALAAIQHALNDLDQHAGEPDYQHVHERAAHVMAALNEAGVALVEAPGRELHLLPVNRNYTVSKVLSHPLPGVAL